MYFIHQYFGRPIYLCFPIFVLASITIAEISTTDDKVFVNRRIIEEFPNLLRIAEQSKKVHLVSELVRNGHRLQIEEFLDLSSWNQLIQFKWHDDHTQAENSNSKSLVANKITVLIINELEGGKKILIQYEPFKCDQKIFYQEGVSTNTGKSSSVSDWRSLMQFSLSQKEDDESIDSKQRHMKTIDTIMSTSPDSPYLTRIPLEDTKNRVWVFGISAVWLKAQFPFEKSQLSLKTRIRDGQLVKLSDIWQLNSKKENLNITYYLDGLSFNDKFKNKQNTNAVYELVQLIEVQDFYLANDVTIFDYINIAAIDFNFDGKSADSLFEVPSGFNCASNPTLQERSNYFENLFDHDFSSSSKMLELELIATKFKGLQDTRFYSSTDIKTVTFATSKHPMNPSKSLVMFHIHEDKYKTIRDYSTRISYTIHFKSIYCFVNKLHKPSKSSPINTEDPTEVYFNNGITLALSVRILEYLFNSTRADDNEMRFINQISISPNKDELTFESRLPENLEYSVNLINSAGRSMEKSISVERVYEQTYFESKEIYKMRRKGLLKLSRIILLVYNQERTQKLAQLRINVIKVQAPMSYTRRAQVFDISGCYKPEEQSMELTVKYPISESSINYFSLRGHELVEEFYMLPLNWLTLKLNTNKDVYDEQRTLQKKRLDLSLNFLRVSKVQAKFVSSNELELYLKMIDRPSPLYLFDEFECSTFSGDQEEEILSVGSPEECAQFCDYLNCRMFAFDRMIFECKLSLKIPELNEQSSEIKSSGRDEAAASIVHKSSSKLFVRPSMDINELGEVSLAEIVSYIQHYNGATNPETLDVDYELSYETSETRTKREVSIDKSPIMSFKYTDKSAGDFAPPVRRLLVPSSIEISNIPISLDVGQEFQRVKVASAFKTTLSSKKYQIEQLSQSKDTSNKRQDEQTYISKLNSAYFTLRKLSSVEIDACAMLCYNIEDWNIRSGGEQTCTAFSYCSFAKQCHLLIKTDFDYLSSSTSVIDIKQESAPEIHSLDDLVKEESDCSIKLRNSLSGYQGPISLPENVFGYASTENINFGLEYEWLRVFKMESSQKEEPEPEKCARECLKLSKSGKLCLAFDYCNSNNPKPAGQSEEVFGNSCHLFLVLNYDKTDRSKIVNEISKTRYQLTRLKSKKDLSIKNSTIHSCQRFLTSHLSEYNQMRHRKLSLQVRDKLESPDIFVEKINLDSCALECSIRGKDCQAFEYCLNYDTKSNSVARKCSLFGTRKRGTSFDEREVPDSSLTEPNKECQVYLRSDKDSLFDLLKFNSLEEDKDDNMSIIADHKSLIISFSALYITAIVLIIVYVKSRRVREFAYRERFSDLLLYFRERFSPAQ